MLLLLLNWNVCVWRRCGSVFTECIVCFCYIRFGCRRPIYFSCVRISFFLYLIISLIFMWGFRKHICIDIGMYVFVFVYIYFLLAYFVVSVVCSCWNNFGFLYLFYGISSLCAFVLSVKFAIDIRLFVFLYCGICISRHSFVLFGIFIFDNRIYLVFIGPRH